MEERNQDIYHAPAYSIADAARYLRIPAATLRSWLQVKTVNHAVPLIQRPDPNRPFLSFVNLVEAHVLRIIRETHQVHLSRVRKALDYMSQQLETDHPLAMQTFQTDGVDLFIDQMDALVNVSRSGQLAMRESLQHLLTRVEWNADGVASRFFPLLERMAVSADDWANDKIIVLDPAVRFGRPVIAGRGVPTDAIADLYEAGETIADIAEEFDCTPVQIKAAIRFESRLLAA